MHNNILMFMVSIMYFKMNMGTSKDAKIVLAEGMDVMNSLVAAMKDNKITNAEKKALAKELRQFSKAAITMLDNITLPE